MNAKHIISLCFAAALVVTGCQDNEWDDHYGVGGNTATESIIQILEGNSRYSQFVDVVRAQHLDTLLRGDQTFTVWAPTNEAMSTYNSADTDVLTHFLQNHINRYVYTTSDLTDTATVRVKMLNGKFQDYSRATGGYTFGGVALGGDQIATNGVVHQLGSVVPFFPNIYEYVKDASNGASKFGTYLQNFDEYEFNKAASTAIGKNNLGQLVYDSVFNYKNPWMRLYGNLYQEDSLYTVVVPTNEAWDEGMTTARKYFRTFGTLDTEKLSTTNVPTRTYILDDALADSLTEAYSEQNIAQSLVFRRLVTPAAPGDSLVATSGNSYYGTTALFSPMEQVTVSNGTIWRATTWPFTPERLYYKEICVEAENTRNRTDAYASVFTRSSSATSFADSVSDQRFIEVTAATTSSRTQPMVQFAIPDVLAAQYDVYVVFAPAQAYVEDATADSTRVHFYLNYVHEDGTMKEDKVIAGGITHGTTMTKMYVGRFTFPFANFSSSAFTGEEKQDDDCVRLRVQTDVSASETTKLSRTMRIDRIIFEPVTE